MKAKTPYRKNVRRIGRGTGSGRGKTSGKGHKGQRARAGMNKRGRFGFEGGQNPLYRRLPKRGFNNNAFRTEYAIINLNRLSEMDVTEITPEYLKQEGVIDNLKSGLKVLGTGEIKKALKISAHKFSGSAKEKIEKAGGQAVIIEKK